MKKKKLFKPVDIKALRKLLRSLSHPSKTQKTQLRNTALVTAAVVLVVGVFAVSPTLQNYFQSQPSEAGLLTPDSPDDDSKAHLKIGPEMKIEVGLSSFPELADAYEDYLLFCANHYPGGVFQRDLFLYNTKTHAPAIPLTNDVGDECVNWSKGKKAAIYGNNIVYVSSTSVLHTYSIYNALDKTIDIYDDKGSPLYVIGLDLSRDQAVLSLMLDPFHAAQPAQLWLYRISDNHLTQIYDEWFRQDYPAIYKNSYIWKDWRDIYNGNTNIYVRKVGSEVEKQIKGSLFGTNDHGDIWGNKIVWTNLQSGTDDPVIYLHDLISGSTKTVASDLADYQMRPLTAGNRFVLFDNGDNATQTVDIYLYDNKYDKSYNLTSDDATVVGNNKKTWWLSNNILYVYYTKYINGERDIYTRRIYINP